MPKPTYTVKWSEEDQEWVATCDKYPSLSWLDPNPDDALTGLIVMIDNEEK